MTPKIVDFDQATWLESGNPKLEAIGLHPIQPDHCCAPDVTLGCGWDISADIWKFGVQIWGIVEHTQLFQQGHDTQGHYDAKAHLAEMIALLGPPPEELLARSNDDMVQYQWPTAIPNGAGLLRWTIFQRKSPFMKI